MADTRETWTVVENGVERTLGYSQTYYPGISGFTDARRVAVGVGQEAGNTDFALIPERASTISGTVYDSQGRPAAGRQVSVGKEFRGPNQTFAMSTMGATVAGDGTFKITGLAPGDYKLSVRTTVDIGGIAVQESAGAVVMVAGVDIDNFSLITSSGWTINGVLSTASGEPVPATVRERTRVVARSLSSDILSMGPPTTTPDNGRVTETSTFAVAGLYGPTRLRVNLPDDWVV